MVLQVKADEFKMFDNSGIQSEIELSTGLCFYERIVAQPANNSDYIWIWIICIVKKVLSFLSESEYRDTRLHN